MCDYQCKPLYTFHEGGGREGGGKLEFWECKGAVCVWQCIFQIPRGALGLEGGK